MTHAVAGVPQFDAGLRPRQKSVFTPLWLLGWFSTLLLCFTDQWILGPSLFVFLLAVRFLRREGEPPAAFAAFTYQWLQVTIALFYLVITGRRIYELDRLDPTRIIIISLAAISVLFGGYALVSRIHRSETYRNEEISSGNVSLTYFVIAYAIAVAVSEGLVAIAWEFPSVTQLFYVLSFSRYVILYLLVSRLLLGRPNWVAVMAVISIELVIGFSGFFASFKDALVFIGLALIVAAGKRKSIWFAIAIVAVVGFIAALGWTSIKPAMRGKYIDTPSGMERLKRAAAELQPAMKNPTTLWNERLGRIVVSRMWQVYFPGLTLKRVPSSVPFEHGRLIKRALENTFKPRIFFPNKGILQSESELVRKYAGARVAGRESKTSIAFGYVAESYVDFGWPMLLVPIFLFGCAVGVVERIFTRAIRSNEILQATRVVLLWSTLYLFERSWTMMIGTLASLSVAVGLVGFILDRVGFYSVSRRSVTEEATYSTAA